MPLVELAIDARWRRDPDGEFVEICPACRATRPACTCGHDFTRLKRGFLVTSWEPAAIDVQPPAICPHCGGPATREIALYNSQYTRLVGVVTARTRGRLLRVRACARAREPAWMYLAFVATTTLTVMFALGAFAAWPAAIVAAGFLALAIASWRAYAWIRFTGFDHRAYRFRVRRADYAAALAEQNGGRVR